MSSVSAVHVPQVLSQLHKSHTSTVDFKQFVVTVVCSLALFSNWTLICHISPAFVTLGVTCCIILEQWLLTLVPLFQYVGFVNSEDIAIGHY